MNIPISAESDFHQPWSMTVTVTPRSSATLATTRGSRTRPAPGSCASATAAGEASSAILRLVTLDVVHRPHESLVQIDLGLPPARLAERILARPVDVRIPEDRERQVVELPVRLQVDLETGLAGPVGIPGADRMRLVRRDVHGIAVDAAAGRRVDDTSHLRLPAAL